MDAFVALRWTVVLCQCGADDLSCGPASGPGARQLRFASLLDPLIQRLQHTRIHRRDHIHRRIELFFRHPRFPCVRKAAIHARIAKPRYHHGEIDQHLLAFGETFDGMRVAIEGSKIGFRQSIAPVMQKAQHAALLLIRNFCTHD